jgi:hypothetical protein
MGLPGAERTDQLSLYYWEDLSDYYNHIELYNNWQTIDAALIKKKFGGTAFTVSGDYAEDIRFAGTVGVDEPVISTRVGIVSSGTLAPNDSYDRFNLSTGGELKWGAGSVDTDVSLSRTDVSTLSLAGTLDSSTLTSVTATDETQMFLASEVDGDTSYRYTLTVGGSANWGSGTASTDVNLYRKEAGVLATDGTFAADTIISANSGTVSFNDPVQINGDITFNPQETGWGQGPLNVGSTKQYDADSVSIDELADVLGNVINALRNYGLLGA